MTEKCQKINECYKVEAVLDQDWGLAELYVNAVCEMCAECKDVLKALE